jgi:L-malate glycosyltransferase
MNEAAPGGTEIHQILTTASPGDAITNAAFALQALLRQVAPSDIFARYVDPALDDRVRHIRHYPGRPSAAAGANVLVYHASIGDPEVLSFLLQRPETLVLQYHNVTPAGFFDPWDPALAALLRDGRRQLQVLRERVALPLAVSHYNASELEALGYRDVAVVPPIVDVTALTGEPPDPRTVQHFTDRSEGPVLLFVGQLLPHKRPDLLVHLAHVLNTFHEPDAQVVLVGSARLERYGRALHDLLRELNLPNVWLTGPVTPSQLGSFFRAADVFVTMSEHEGLCIPLLESMAFDVPVVARRYAAIPETLADAGLLLPAGAGPELACEAVLHLLSSSGDRDDVVAAGRSRLAAFDPDHARAGFLQALQRVLEP